MAIDLLAVASHGLFQSGGGGSCDYPSVTDVREGIVYANGTMTGVLVLPPSSQVLLGVGYGAYGSEFIGSLDLNGGGGGGSGGGGGNVTLIGPAGTNNPYAMISQAIVNRVQAALNVAIQFIRPVASDSYRVTETESLFAYIRSYAPYPADPSTGAPLEDYGAARHSRVVGRRFRIYLYTRTGVDTYGGDEVALHGGDPNQTVTTPPGSRHVIGQFVVEEIVINALDDYQPLGNNGLPLSVSPIHWISPEGGPPERAPENSEGLVRSALDFQVLYNLAEQQVEPAPTILPRPISVKA